MPSPSFPFLKLPSELRNAIYEQYALVEGGYIYDFETGKLRAANDPKHPIDLALMYTCTQIANEMKGFALSCNVVTFRTFSSPDLDLRAGYFDEIMKALAVEAAYLFEYYTDRDHDPSHAHNCLNKRVLDELIRVFPKCRPLLHLARHVDQGLRPIYNRPGEDCWFFISRANDEDAWCGVPSITRELLFYAIEVVSKLGGWLPNELTPPHAILAHDLLEIQSTYMPWAIPTENEINYAIRKFDKTQWTEKEIRIGEIRPFSAAAVAIKFLHDTPISTRKYIRKIVIHEDRTSVAFPECHAKGLIPFCVENPFLHIERRLDLWRAILRPSHYYLHLGSFWGWWPGRDIRDADNLARWIVEAIDLFRAGMPEKSFSLVLDGEPALEASSEFFRIVQKAAMWQEAYVKAQKLLPTPSPYRIGRYTSFYIREHFPRILRAMTDNESFFIQCNFNIDFPRNIEQIIDQNRHYSLDRWGQNYDQDGDETGEQLKKPFPPFRSWHDFYIAEYVYPTERWRYADDPGHINWIASFNYPEN
ncbi:hypothetical protein F4679DRAFT_592209 [Xylaria curta]|nr:hypothetical protein F4679DRAFT_592209 [Xylaria curta]